MVEKLEEILFKYRALILAAFAAFTVYSGYYATNLRMDAGFEKQLPSGHEYIQTPGLGWIDGAVHKIAPSDLTLKIPHMGWNNLVIDHPHPIFDGIETGDHAYFVHSYQMQVATPEQRIAHVDYAGDVTAVVARDTMIGLQFHPEKSASQGLRMIGNFLNWRP